MEVRRWTRFGQDRLYVHDSAGHEVGWWDLVANEAHPSIGDGLAVLTAEVDAWRERRGMSVPRRAATTDAGDRIPKRGIEKAQPPARAHTGPAFVPPENATQRRLQQSASLAVVHNSPGVDVRVLNARAGMAPAPVDLVGNRAGQNLHPQIVAADSPVGAPVNDAPQPGGGISSWEKGAVGEAIVADELARLTETDPRWGFLNSVPVGRRGSDIDHIVIGPAGVFTVNAKHHDGANIWVGEDTFLVNGHRQRYVRNSRHEAARATKLLTAASGFHIPIRGVIVPVNARTVDIRKPPAGVDVVPAEHLVYYLWTLPIMLNHHTIQAVFAHARDSTTWAR